MKISDSNISSACMFKETCARLPRTQTSLARAQRKAGRTLPMVPCGSSLVARLYLAKNEAPEEEAVRALHD